MGDQTEDDAVGEECEGEKENALAYTGLVRKHEGTKPLGRPRRRQVDSINRYLKE
jgi:hypothetical protein